MTTKRNWRRRSLWNAGRRIADETHDQPQPQPQPQPQQEPLKLLRAGHESPVVRRLPPPHRQPSQTAAAAAAAAAGASATSAAIITTLPLVLPMGRPPVTALMK